MNITKIESYQELQEKINQQERSFLVLYKSSSDLSLCAMKNVESAAHLVNDIHLYAADVSQVKDIHSHYQVTSVPTLLSFENGSFKNLYKGCNHQEFYKSLFENATFYVSGSGEDKKTKSVTVYSTPTCSFCNSLKSYLRKKGIRFRDVDISRDSGMAQELVSRTGQTGVPQTDIDGQMVVGFDRIKINQLLDIQGE
ncbi:MAG: glutaredoxin domain-containing protein [Candidatus Cyclobacteriaceae bacterium M3_2C_046]